MTDRNSAARSVLPGRTDWLHQRLLRRLGVMLRDRQAMAAVEFAFIAPVLLALYFLTVEISQGIESSKKVGRIASMTADLVAQQQIMTLSELDAILDLGESAIQPYNRTKPTITITGIEITDEKNPKVTVAWSRKLNNGTKRPGASAGSSISIPSKLVIRDTFLIRVETELNYKPIIVWTAGQKAEMKLSGAFSSVDMSETYHLRPRMSRTIRCLDC